MASAIARWPRVALTRSRVRPGAKEASAVPGCLPAARFRVPTALLAEAMAAAFREARVLREAMVRLVAFREAKALHAAVLPAAASADPVMAALAAPPALAVKMALHGRVAADLAAATARSEPATLLVAADAASVAGTVSEVNAQQRRTSTVAAATTAAEGTTGISGESKLN